VEEVCLPPEADYTRGEALLHIAETHLRRQGDLAWIGGIHAHRALYSLVYHQPYSSTISFARQALPFLDRPEITDHRLRKYRSVCLLFASTEKLHLGQPDAARRMLLQAWEDNRRSAENRFISVDLHLSLGKCYLMQGELKLARRSLNQALIIASELQDSEVIADVLLELAWVALELNDPQTAAQHTRNALNVIASSNPAIPALQEKATLHRALLQHTQGETQAALEQMAELATHLSSDWTPASIGLAARLRTSQQRLQTSVRATAAGSILAEPLSSQEERVLRLLAAGWSNQEIASELIISVNTVKYHLKNLYQKLGVSNRLQASTIARQILPSDQARAPTR
jgi:ATP/maltotriose-dependent transcriptional regulator MalT